MHLFTSLGRLVISLILVVYVNISFAAPMLLCAPNCSNYVSIYNAESHNTDSSNEVTYYQNDMCGGCKSCDDYFDSQNNHIELHKLQLKNTMFIVQIHKETIIENKHKPEPYQTPPS